MKCRALITKRLEERSKDIRLNPFLYKACRMDMHKFCKEELESKIFSERNGKVIDCLKVGAYLYLTVQLL